MTACPRLLAPDTPCGVLEVTRSGWCGSCTLTAHHTLTALPEVYVELHLALTATGMAGEPVSGTATAPTPIRTDVRALAEDILDTTSTWESDLRRHLTHSARPPRGREAPTLLGAVRYLTAYLPEAVAYAPEEAERVIHLRRTARLLLGQTRLVHRLPAACPRCNVLALTRLDGSDWVMCDSCGAGWDGRGYDDLVRAQAAAITLQVAS